MSSDWPINITEVKFIVLNIESILSKTTKLNIFRVQWTEQKTAQLTIQFRHIVPSIICLSNARSSNVTFDMDHSNCIRNKCQIAVVNWLVLLQGQYQYFPGLDSSSKTKQTLHYVSRLCCLTRWPPLIFPPPTSVGMPAMCNPMSISSPQWIVITS